MLLYTFKSFAYFWNILFSPEEVGFIIFFTVKVFIDGKNIWEPLL